MKKFSYIIGLSLLLTACSPEQDNETMDEPNTIPVVSAGESIVETSENVEGIIEEVPFDVKLPVTLPIDLTESEGTISRNNDIPEFRMTWKDAGTGEYVSFLAADLEMDYAPNPAEVKELEFSSGEKAYYEIKDGVYHIRWTKDSVSYRYSLGSEKDEIEYTREELTEIIEESWFEHY